MNYKPMVKDYEKIYKCIRSCTNLKQLPACKKLVNTFIDKYEDKYYISIQSYRTALDTHLEYQKMKITNHKPQNHDQN